MTKSSMWPAAAFSGTYPNWPTYRNISTIAYQCNIQKSNRVSSGLKWHYTLVKSFGSQLSWQLSALQTSTSTTQCNHSWTGTNEQAMLPWRT